MHLAIVLPVALTLAASPLHAGRILAVFPTVSKSHFDFFQPLLLALASRGHRITVVNSYPQAPPVSNYTDISLREFKKVFFNDITFDAFYQIPISWTENQRFLLSQVPEIEGVFYHPDVSKLIQSEENFDLVLVEFWNSDVSLGFGHRFNAPVIGMSSCNILPWFNGRFGNPDNPAYIPNIFLRKIGRLDFWERLVNTLQLGGSKLAYRFLYDPKAQIIARKFFGETLPPLGRLAEKTSMMFVNMHHSLYGPRPLSPQVIEVGGLHVQDPRPLHKELDRWMNESSNGVIYFSFGSMLRGATLPMDKVKAFLQVFGSLSQRVLWKWEDDTVDNLPNNVKIMKWIPQRDVLAHPNVRVFISHGGLLGTTEAVVSGVPILGIPMYGDQPNNVAALVENGVAVHVDYNNISVASLSYALNVLLHDKRYRERAQELSFRFLDRPMSPLDTAVYWTEYVIRHRGAPHLQSAAVHLSWYQYYLLDVIAVVVSAVLLILSFTYYTIRSCLGFVCSSKPNKLKSN